ncbi:aromatic ring-hydroxylating dioxygenase subunit alpha [Leisingera thetidis]|uniref:aromatic ring-hydroxylating dioxygenase subunit alpha n=1 Tax=Leisingera thetidis TaxID=2930199 RepID=UPI0021F6BF5E|nr:aromatic ring-hydroxylating dioxygenase subunit alpha [Leisingera thetidis]
MFLKNAWYVAAWSSEITTDLKQVIVLGEKICMYRDQAGKIVALEDACPHRKLPLSMGRIAGGNVECGYHGLTFDCSGACVAAPGKGRIPSNAVVHSYPVEESYELIWIWMGDPELADTSEIFKIENYDNADWGINRGAAMEIKCNYKLMTDNLLDPTHVAWVHQTSFAQDAARDTPLTLSKNDDGVVVHRWMMDVEPAPFYKHIVQFEGNADRLQKYEVRYPCHALIRSIFTPAGTGGSEDALHKDAFVMDSYNFMTPTTEDETRYYWFQLRNIRADDDELSARMSDAVKGVFEEDIVILEAVQTGLSEERNPHIDLSIDGGPLRFRRELEALIVAEQQSGAAAEA